MFLCQSLLSTDSILNDMAKIQISHTYKSYSLTFSLQYVAMYIEYV